MIVAVHFLFLNIVPRSNWERMLRVLLSMQTMANHCYWVLMVDEAVSDICRRVMDIERPKDTTLNRLIEQLVSLLSGSLRFGGAPT
jgi:hypothetical protein